MERIISFVIGYFLGCIESGYIYGKLHHIDIREHGSGNAGATNTLRTLGAKAGLIVLLTDAGKTLLAMLIAYLIYHTSQPDTYFIYCMYAGLGAIMGHNFPFYLKFKGGKGIACTGGTVIGFACLTHHYYMIALGIAIFVGVVVATKYVSLSSLIIVSLFMLSILLYGSLTTIPGLENPLELYGIGVVLTVCAFYRHKANIKRLWTHTENKISLKKKEAE